MVKGLIGGSFLLENDLFSSISLMGVIVQNKCIFQHNLGEKYSERILGLSQFDSIPGTLQDAGATSNTSVGVVENRYSLF